MTKIMSEIISICKSLNMSQRELAEKSNISDKSISLYFNDNHTPNLEYVEDMAKALGYELKLAKIESDNHGN